MREAFREGQTVPKLPSNKGLRSATSPRTIREFQYSRVSENALLSAGSCVRSAAQGWNPAASHPRKAKRSSARQLAVSPNSRAEPFFRPHPCAAPSPKTFVRRPPGGRESRQHLSSLVLSPLLLCHPQAPARSRQGRSHTAPHALTHPPPAYSRRDPPRTTGQPASSSTFRSTPPLQAARHQLHRSCPPSTSARGKPRSDRRTANDRRPARFTTLAAPPPTNRPHLRARHEAPVRSSGPTQPTASTNIYFARHPRLTRGPLSNPPTKNPRPHISYTSTPRALPAILDFF